MKAILEYDLNDPNEAIDHMRAVKSGNLTLAIHDMLAYLRIESERDNNLTGYEMIEVVKEEFSSILESLNIDIDEIF